MENALEPRLWISRQDRLDLGGSIDVEKYEFVFRIRQRIKEPGDELIGCRPGKSDL
jgi:hypothetical protein